MILEHTTPHSPMALSGRFTVPEEAAGTRLDRVLADLFPQFSRSRWQAWLKAGRVHLDGALVPPRYTVSGGETLDVDVEVPAALPDAPEPMALDVVFEDSALLVVNKPAGLVVHPAAGNRAGTLLNGLLHHVPDLARLPRAGLVHRLDKDTTGLLVVAKTPAAHGALVGQLQSRRMGRVYAAVVQGCPVTGGTVEAPIGRDPTHRQRMAVRDPGGRPAVTHYRVAERFRAHARLRVRLETGRTHQIRVHLAHAGHPLVGDRTYGGRPRVPPGAGRELVEALQGFPRQALHAAELQLDHPATGERREFHAALPRDLASLLVLLRADARTPGDD